MSSVWDTQRSVFLFYSFDFEGFVWQLQRQKVNISRLFCFEFRVASAFHNKAKIRLFFIDFVQVFLKATSSSFTTTTTTATRIKVFWEQTFWSSNFNWEEKNLRNTRKLYKNFEETLKSKRQIYIGKRSTIYSWCLIIEVHTYIYIFRFHRRLLIRPGNSLKLLCPYECCKIKLFTFVNP